MKPVGARPARRTSLGGGAAVFLAPGALAGERVNKDAEGVAIRGYDPVAYFTLGRPVVGSPDLEHVWHDARWRFATAEHRAMFAAEPERYAPRFGGFCTGGVAFGNLAPIDPEAWIIVDGRLYLHHDKAGRDETAASPGGAIAAAARNWATLGREGP
jgi:hypothetical protein